MNKKIIIYNPLGNTKGHSKVYASGIINGFLKRKFQTYLITSFDFLGPNSLESCSNNSCGVCFIIYLLSNNVNISLK